MNKEQLRLKLIEAWSKGLTRIDLTKVDFGRNHDWGFIFTPIPAVDFNEFLGCSYDEFYNCPPEVNEYMYSIALEISNFPLNKALS